MKIYKSQDIEYSVVRRSELHDDIRIDSDYYYPEYVRNAQKIQEKNCYQIKDFMSPTQYGISIAMNDNGIGYKMLKMDDITHVLADDENSKYAVISKNQFEKHRLNKFDVLFNRVNSDEYVGRTGIYLLDGNHTFASYLVRVTSKKSYQNCYLTIYLNTKFGYKSLQRVKRRAVNQANINAREFSNLTVPFPDVDLQREIEKLVIKAYELKKKSIENYKESEKLLLDDLELLEWEPGYRTININGKGKFVTKDTISKITSKRVKKIDRLDSDYWENYLVKLQEKIRSYKNGWNFLAGICQINDEKFTPNDDKTYNYIELSNIGQFGNIKGFTVDTGQNLPTRARLKVKTNQVIISSLKGSSSSCALITKKFHNFLCSTGFYVIESEKINPPTLVVLFKTKPFQYLLKRGCTGTILDAINKRFFRLIPIPKISMQVQNEIEDRINSMYALRAKSREMIDIATKAIETYIDKDSNIAIEYIKSRTRTGKDGGSFLPKSTVEEVVK